MPDPSAELDSRFDEEFQHHGLSVFRLALAWTNDWRSAEDLAQDAFLRLWAKRESLDWSASMLPWLLTTTRHLATDRFRRLRRAVLFATPGGSSIAALDTDARLRWLDVRRGLSSLTRMQRSALVLSTVVGLDTQAVAEAVGTTPGGVRAAISRARAALVGDDAVSD